MHKKNFIVWYYSDGLKNIIQAIKNILKFIPHFFSFKLFTENLFHPWRRNILIKNWKKFNFFLFIKYWWLNFWLRFFGFSAKILVLFFGSLIYLLAIILGILFFVYYFSFPAIISLAIGMCFSSLLYFGLTIIFIQFIFLTIIYRKFETFDHRIYQKMSIEELNKTDWFYRIYERLGVKKENVPVEILTDFKKFEEFLKSLEITTEECEKIISWEIEKQTKKEQTKSFFSEEKLQYILPIGLYWNFGKTPILDSFAEDLIKEKNDFYSDFPFVGYEEEVSLIENILSRKNENNVLIAGPSGSGRKKLVHELARKVKMGEYNQNNRILVINFEKLSQQIKKVNNPLLFLENLFQEIVLAGNVILVIDDLEKCLKIGNDKFSFADFLYQYAQFPSLRIIGIANENSFEKNQEKWLENFEVVYITEMSKEETMQVLFSYFYGEKHTPFTFQSLRQIIANSSKIYETLPLPTRAINLAQEILAFWEKEKKEIFISAELVNIFTSRKNVLKNHPFARKEKEIFSLENNFYEKIVGQDLAINSLSGAIRRMREEKENNDFHSFLFFGSVGTGKKEMVKVFSEQYFGKEKIVEIEIGDLLENTNEKLFGLESKNKIGIFSQLKNEKNAVILFKNLEKANQEILTALSFILKNGFIYDNFKQKISFQNLVLIATFNTEFLFMKNLVEKNLGLNKMKELILNHFSRKTIFTADFLNKFEEMILFFPLNSEEIYKITENLLNKFSVNFQLENQVEVFFEEKVIVKIVENSFNENLGAKSLQNYIETELKDFLIAKIIRENVQRGTSIYFGLRDMN